MPQSPNLGFTYPTPLDPATQDLWGATLNTLFLLLDSEAALRTIDQDFGGRLLSNASLKDTDEDAYDLGNLSGAVTVDYRNGHYQYGTLTGNITSLTITNWPPDGKAGWMTLELSQDGSGNRTLALGSQYRSAGGQNLALTSAASAVDKLRLEGRDGGTTIDAFINLNLS